MGRDVNRRDPVWDTWRKGESTEKTTASCMAKKGRVKPNMTDRKKEK